MTTTVVLFDSTGTETNRTDLRDGLTHPIGATSLHRRLQAGAAGELPHSQARHAVNFHTYS